MDIIEQYLGDGLYASFDGFQIKLRAPRIKGDHEVFLDAYTLKAFQIFIEHIDAAIKGARSA